MTQTAINEAIKVLKQVRQSCLFEDDHEGVGVTEDPSIPSELFDEICKSISTLEGVGNQTPEPTIPEGSFHILVGRDATAYFDAIIPAASLEEAKGKISKDGYDCDDSVVWTERSPESFDHIEVCVITSPDGTSAHWEEQTLWDEE
jgi:hypothetical protein